MTNYFLHAHSFQSCGINKRMFLLQVDESNKINKPTIINLIINLRTIKEYDWIKGKTIEEYIFFYKKTPLNHEEILISKLFEM